MVHIVGVEEHLDYWLCIHYAFTTLILLSSSLRNNAPPPRTHTVLLVLRALHLLLHVRLLLLLRLAQALLHSLHSIRNLPLYVVRANGTTGLFCLDVVYAIVLGEC